MDRAVRKTSVPIGSVYTHTDDGSLIIPMPLIGFYTSMPEEAKCIFSISRAVPEKRHMQHLFPRRELNRWTPAKIHQKVQSIRSAHPPETLCVKKPRSWTDLFDFFDAVDLWEEGAWNLWLVIHRLIQEVDIEQHEVTEWVYKWLTSKENRNKLTAWKTETDVLDIMAASDWLEGGLLEGSANARDLVRLELDYWYKSTYSPALTVQNWIGKKLNPPHILLTYFPNPLQPFLSSLCLFSHSTI